MENGLNWDFDPNHFVPSERHCETGSLAMRHPTRMLLVTRVNRAIWMFCAVHSNADAGDLQTFRLFCCHFHHCNDLLTQKYRVRLKSGPLVALTRAPRPEGVRRRDSRNLGTTVVYDRILFRHCFCVTTYGRGSRAGYADRQYEKGLNLANDAECTVTTVAHVGWR